MLRIALLLAVLAFGLTTAARAQAPYDSPFIKDTPVGWAWEQIRNGKVANFSNRCPDPHSDAEWNSQRECRQIPAQFLSDVLTVPKWRDQIPRHLVQIHGALIPDKIDLSHTNIDTEVSIEASKFEKNLDISDSNWEKSLSLEASKAAGNVDLSRAKIHGQLNMTRGSFAKVNAEDVHVGSHLRMGEGASFRGKVVLRNANIGGILNMDRASFASTVNADSVQVGSHLIMGDDEASLGMGNKTNFGGEMILRDANIGGVLNMDGASFASKMDAESVHVGSHMLMSEGASFRGEVVLRNANIGGQLNMTRGSFAKVNAEGVHVGSHMLMSDVGKRTVFKDKVILRNARIDGQLNMNYGSFAKVNAEGVHLGAYLLMSERAVFGDKVILAGANIGGILYMNRASFASTVNAQNVRVGVHLRMGDDEDIPGGHKSSFWGGVLLRGATVDGELDMRGSSFAADVDASGLHVGSSLFMGKGASFGGKVNLTGATIRGSLVLTGLRWTCPKGEASTDKDASKPDAEAAPVRWPLGDPLPPAPCGKADATKLPTLNLRNLHVDAFQDSLDAWPPSLELDGFHYDRLGEFGADKTDSEMPTKRDDEMPTRAPRAWRDWLERDRTFSTQPYVQLASVLMAAGNRGTAEAIQFAGREGERTEAWKKVRGGHLFLVWLLLSFLLLGGGYSIGVYTPFMLRWMLVWVTVFTVLDIWVLGDGHALLVWLFLTFLLVIGGYGIGLYTFFVLGWVIGLTVLAACGLHFSPGARRRSLLWRLGASLQRLLPIIELDKEFKDFFDDPRNLTRLQRFLFVLLAITGWVLGSFLLAAMGGLTQKG